MSTCIFCKKQFTPRKDTKGLYCSYPCMYEHKRQPNTTCEQCKIPFRVVPSLLNKKRYCSRKCERAFKTKPNCICSGCGKHFHKESKQLKKRKRPFCSYDCFKLHMAVPIEIRFKKYIGQKLESGCIPWTGATNQQGYGVIGGDKTNKGINKLAHRVSYEIENGNIPKGLDVLHTCDNPICVNPDHLFTGTHKDNMNDRDSKGRVAKGELQGGSKLTRRMVKEIRKLYNRGKVTYRMLANKYGIASLATIYNVVSRKSWKHVP